MLRSAIEEQANARQLPARYNMQTELTFNVPREGTASANFELTTHEPGIVPVSGKITVDGRPGADLLVLFEPLSSGDGSANQGSIGATDVQGIFTLVTMLDRNVGAMVGEHRVRITSQLGPGAAGEAPENDGAMLKAAMEGLQNRLVPKQLPARYNAETELIFKVPEEGTNSANFELTTN